MRASLRTCALVIGSVVALSLAAPVVADADTLWIHAGRVLTGDGEDIADAAILVRSGTIRKVAPVAELPAPEWARMIDARDQVVIPGFVVPLSRMGMPSGSPRQGGRNAGYRPTMDTWLLAARDLYPFDERFDRLLEAGITTIGFAPRGSGGVLGHAVAVRTRAESLDERMHGKSAGLVLDVDRRSAWADAVSEAFQKARDQVKKAEEAAKKSGDEKKKQKPPDPATQGVRMVVEGSLPLVITGSGAGGWETFHGAVEPEGMQLVVEDSSDLYRVAERVAESGATVLTRPVITNEPYTSLPVNRAAAFRQAGVEVAFLLPEDSLAGARNILDAMIRMSRTGMSREDVIAAVTSTAATALGLDKTVGSVAKGREANLLFLTGDPFDPTSRIARILAGGTFLDEETDE